MVITGMTLTALKIQQRKRKRGWQISSGRDMSLRFRWMAPEDLWGLYKGLIVISYPLEVDIYIT